MGIFGKIAALLKSNERRELVLLALVSLGVALFEVAGVASIMPFLAVVSNPQSIQENEALRWIWDRGGFSEVSAYLFALGLLVFTLVVITNLLNTLNAWLSHRFIALRNHSISTRLLAHYLQQPYSYFLGRNTADMGANILIEVEKATRIVMMQAIILVTRIVSLCAILLLLILVDPLLALLILTVIGGVYGLFFLSVRSYLRRSGTQRHALVRARYRIANEAFGGIKDVKVRDLGDRFVRRYSIATERFARIEVITSVLAAVPRYVLEVASFGTILLILLLQLERGRDLSSVVPVMGLYALAGLRLMPAVQAIFAAATKLRHHEPILESLLKDLQHREASQEAEPEPCPPLNTSLSFHEVGFRYEAADAPTLQGINLMIPRRSTIGLVGSTGAGKTTLLDLILGLLAPQSGEIRVDGVPLSSGMRRDWRTRVGYVPQHIFLMDDSLRANIAFGLDPGEVDEERIHEAARLASLDTFVQNELPEGYETRVGERGVRLSGGQIQRVGIARALYHDPELLLFDEATSALDNVTERTIMEAIDNLAGEKTIVLIAHRLTTVRRCDRIYMLEQGRVRASGTWDELMESSPEFRIMAASDDPQGDRGRST